MTETASEISRAYRALPSSTRTAAETLCGPNRPVTWSEILLLVARGMEAEREKLQIVAAACLWNSLTISLPRPHRHHHILHAMCSAGFPEDAALTCIQGFIDGNGDFYDREQAKQLVKATGQPTIADYRPNQLFSEDLW